MTGTMLTATIIDIILAMTVIAGLIHEEKLIAFEDRIIFALAKVYKKHMRRRYMKKRAAQKAQLRVISSSGEYRTFNKSA